MTAYTDGFARTQEWLKERKRSPSMVFDRLADLRARRRRMVAGSDQWMGLIGETTALLRAFPHLAGRERFEPLHSASFSSTEPGRPSGAGVEQ